MQRLSQTASHQLLPSSGKVLGILQIPLFVGGINIHQASSYRMETCLGLKYIVFNFGNTYSVTKWETEKEYDEIMNFLKKESDLMKTYENIVAETIHNSSTPKE